MLLLRKFGLLFLMSILIFSCESKPKRPVYLNMLFNFKQASYKGVSFKPLNSPFTRFNLTQKYFGLAYRLNKHPQLHATVSLSSTLLKQL